MAQVDDPRTERSDRLAASLDRARAGDLSALDPVVRELNPLLWHVARAQGLTTTQAADVVQNTWLELVAKLDGIRSPAALTGWLVTVTKREAWRISRRQRTETPDLPERAAADEQLDAGLLRAERDRALWACFRRLSERCQQLLRVVAMVDRPSYTELAETLEMPIGSLGPTRGRCLAKLRALLVAHPQWSSS